MMLPIFKKLPAKFNKLLFIGIGVTILNFNLRPLNNDQLYDEDINRIHNDLLKIKKTIQIEQIRLKCIAKITSIIRRYNPFLDEEIKMKIAQEIYEMSIIYDNLDIELICATITHESALSWNPEVISPAGAMGLMQIMPFTGAYLSSVANIPWHSAEQVLFNPVNNIQLGCRYLSSLIKAYNIDGGLAAYNGGMKRAEKWLQNGRADGILLDETAFYVPSILKIYEEYKRLN